MDFSFTDMVPLNHPPSIIPSELSSPSSVSYSPTPDSSPPPSQHQLPDSNTTTTTTTTTIEPLGGSLGAFQSSNMDRIPFDALSDRRSNYLLDRAGNPQSHDMRLNFPTSTPRYNEQRSFMSTNWRVPGPNGDGSSIPSSSTSTTFGSLMAPASPTTIYGRYSVVVPHSTADMAAGTDFTMFPRALGQAQVAESELDEIYAYCFDRGNGQYTRLIPADMLPKLQGIPSRQQGCVGMKVLPVPPGLAPNGRSSNTERVELEVRVSIRGFLCPENTKKSACLLI